MTIKEWEDKLLPAIQSNIDLICENLNSGDVFVDVGSNTGLLSNKIIEKVGNDFLSKMILVEPIPEYATECKGKFQTNPNVFVFEGALSNANGVATIHTSNQNFGYNKIHKKGMEIQDGEDVEVKLYKFSNLVKELSLSKVDFVKIDTEGHEVEVIEGMMEWMDSSKNRPTILFEIGWYEDTEKYIIDKLIKEYNYELVFSKNDALLKQKTK
jgi:FkbM family methyltransferase